MKTFTTCAEKKAKQFFNLLQGYTKGIRITAILILLLMGVNNAWAASEGSSWYDWASSENVYFDNTNSSYTNVSMLIGRQWTYGSDGIGSSGVNFTKVANTNNLYHAATTWNHYNTLLFIDATGWGWEGNKVTQRYTYADNYTNTNNININGTELFYAASSTKGATLNHQDLSGYAALNSQQTIHSAVNGAVANSKATISITSYKMTAHKTTTEQTATLGTGANVSYIDAARTATTTLTVGTVATGYQFDGWYTAATGGTQLSSSTTYTYYPTAATTVYARFSAKKYTITYKDQGGGAFSGTHASGHPTTHTYGTTTTLKTATKDGYTFEGWFTNSGCTGSAVNSLGATAYTANITLYAKWTANETLYNVDIKAEEGGSVSKTEVSVNESITEEIIATPNEGYKFVGWKTEGGAQVADKDRFSTINATSTTVTATATGSVTALFEALLPNTLTLTHQPMYKDQENPLEGAGGDGSEATPYKIYSEEVVRITATELPAVDGLTAHYKFGELEQESNVFDFNNISSSTATKINVKAYYKKDGTRYGDEVSADSYYFLILPLPYYVSTVPSNEMSLERIAAGEDIKVQFRSDDKTTVNLYVQIGDDESTKTWLKRISSTASYDYDYVVPDNIEPCVLRFIAESEGLHNGRSFSKYAEVALYKNVTIKVNDPNGIMSKVYMWRGDDIKSEWPGESFAQNFDTWRVFVVKYPYYDHFVLNDGTNENQTFDYIIPAEDKCYQLSENKVEVGGYTNYQITETTCPSDLMVSDIKDVTIMEGEQIVVMPEVLVGLGYKLSDVEVEISNSNTNSVRAMRSGTNITVLGTSEGSATITVTYTLGDESVPKTFDVTVEKKNSITIQVKVPTEHGPEADRIGWWENDKIYVRYWNAQTGGTDQKMNYLTQTDYHYYFEATIPLDNTGKTNFNIFYDNRNEDWRYSTNAPDVTEDGCYLVYNDGSGDRGLRYEGVRCLTQYQVRIAMGNGKTYTSNIVTAEEDILSFFAPGMNETGYKTGVVMLYENDKMIATINPARFVTSNVYVVTLDSIRNGSDTIPTYSGNYYIRTWGKDDDISNKGTQSVSTWTADEKKSRSMTFFISREGEFYNHYWVQAMAPHDGGKDVSAWVANEYNDDLAGKLTGDKNTNESGYITFANTMNVRFGYDPRTNYFGRAILRGSGQNQDYLNLHCNNAYSDAACTKQLPYGTSNLSNKFRDISNWVYEREVYVKIDNNNPSASMYIEARSPRNDKSIKNHLLGYIINEGTGEETSNPIQKTVIGSGTDNGVYKVRVVYDFKTNRMISVWQPDDIEVSTSKTLHADILFIRKENEQAPQITLTGDGQIKSIESVFFALELTRGDANANRHEEQYMFTLPFDCVVGSISGVPGYMEIWGIQRYRGDLRAQKGWYAETATFWEWMSLTDTLKAGEGYLLAFDKKNAHWEEFLEEDLVTKTSLLRLYFPSVQKGFDLKQKSGQQLTVTYPNHPCTLELHNRYLQDSNWKMIGTTSYNNATIEGYAKDDNPSYDELHDAPSFRYRYSYAFDNNNNRTSYGYEPENGKTATYQSFYGYMVQFAGTITWNPINETVPKPLAAPRRAQAERSSVTMCLELANTDGEKQDQTFVALDEDGTTTFDQNKDLNKVFNSGKSNIYTLSESIPFAGNTLPMDEVIVPVGVKIDAEGEYTFRMPDGTEGMVVELIDYERDITTNLLLFDYTVTLPAGSNESRFALHIQPNKSGVTTGVENVGDKAKGIEKYLIDGKLIIRTAEGVFDAQGKRL